jgi:hypothetical protein
VREDDLATAVTKPDEGILVGARADEEHAANADAHHQQQRRPPIADAAPGDPTSGAGSYSFLTSAAAERLASEHRSASS